MSLILGIHNGHHSSCAMVKDGKLVSAIQQERVTGIKGDGADGLTNRLPIQQCLDAAQATLSDVECIVSSFQSVAPGGVGLSRPLAQPGFDLFDPFDPRHMVISHHLAHAFSTMGCSGFSHAAVLVCDLAGSTTTDGNDFALSFGEFNARMSRTHPIERVLTECASIYDIRETRHDLRHRDFCIPHNAPETFVCSPSSLYDNVARLVFGKENAHGELMALASLPGETPCEVSPECLVESISPRIVFRNDWQEKVRLKDRQLDYVPLAAVVQSVIQKVLLEYARKARALSGSTNLAAAGGIFLNINANSEIANSGLFEQMYVPSSPHDAGISAGCAFYGWRTLVSQRQWPSIVSGTKAPDRLGPVYSQAQVDHAIAARQHLLAEPQQASPALIARLLHDQKIIARFAGRSEFGPRALGGRSLLATPLSLDSKDRLNVVKGRQPWRPVAPIVLRERLGEFFVGPEDSPYMNFVHLLKEEHREALQALVHPDGSARAQTLSREDDPNLYETIEQFALLSGYPILVNTSFNGPGEPIVETPDQALDFFLPSDPIDYLLFGDILLERRKEIDLKGARLAQGCFMTVVGASGHNRFLAIRGRKSLELSRSAFHLLEQGEDLDGTSASGLQEELGRAMRHGILAVDGSTC